MRTTTILALAALAAAACQAPPASFGPPREAPAARTAPLAAEPVLYARDGSVVAPASGDAALPRRDVQEGTGTRTRLLELYERVVEERDGLQAALAARDEELAQLRRQLDQQSARTAELESRSLASERANAQLAQQNLDLAGRLTTAQIKRLEAEKAWLELALGSPARTVPTASPASAAPAVQPAVHAVPSGGEHP